MSDPADRAAACLAEARRRWEAFGEADSAPRLLAAVEAALALHVAGEEMIIYAACSAHNIMRTAGEPDRFRKMRDCPECIKTPHLVCRHCDRDWPCPDYRDITTALLGDDAE